jgi:hypothetical protein
MTSRTRRRPSSAQASRLQIIAFCEGEKTEVVYLTHWYRLHRDRTIVTCSEHEYTTPFDLVAAAVDQRRLDLKEAKRGRGRAYDQYWCMFDVDEHPRLLEALELAAANEIRIALSSPCLELWFLIHFEDRTAYIDRHQAQRGSRSMLGCGKALTPVALESLVSKYEEAKKRALLLAAKHEGDDSAKPWNPYSEVWKLIDVIVGGSDDSASELGVSQI